MANGIKTYKIVINGVQESIDAVKSLNEQLKSLEDRIKVLESKTINIKATSSTSTTGGGSKSSSVGQLSEEEKLLKQIEQTERKIKAYSKDIYQNYMASKDQLKEVLNDQKQIAAQERLQANTYSNTMQGLKEKLADIKNVMQTTDIGSDIFKKYTAEANEITNKLKELEEAYGQFGRNVGNYKSAIEGFDKIKVTVGDTVREYDNYKKAMKSLQDERFKLANSVGRETKAYKDVDVAIKKLQSDYKDLETSSSFMDNMLDTAKSMTAVMGVGTGLSVLFGIDDSSFRESMERLGALLLVLKSIEELKLEWQKDEGWFFKPFKKISEGASYWGEKIGDNIISGIQDAIDGKNAEGIFGKFFNKYFKAYSTYFEKQAKKMNPIDAFDDAVDEMSANPKRAKELSGFIGLYSRGNDDLKQFLYGMAKAKTKLIDLQESFINFGKKAKTALLVVSKALAGLFTLGFMAVLPNILEWFGDFIKSLDKTKTAAEQANKSLNALNRSLEKRMELIGSSYMKGQISSEEYLKRIYDEQTEALDKQIMLLRERADAAKDNGILGTGWFKGGENLDFSGQRMTGETTISNGMFAHLDIVVKNITEVEKAWRRANQAIKDGKDYIDKWGEDDTWYQRLMKEWGSIFVTVEDTKEAMRGLGNVKLSDTVAQFQEITRELNNGTITTEEYAKEIAKLRDEMNNNEILNSVIANLDKYIPDEEVREQVQNIIDKIYELDDAFNMTSPQQIHHWNQVRIDAMKEGFDKTMAQIQENERYEIEQEAKTDEQRALIEAKYERQRQNAREKAAKENLQKAKEQGKKLADAENQLMALRIENMKNGLKKRLAELDNQRRLELDKAKENGVMVGELSLEINKKYDRLILDEKRKWAFDMLRTYEDLMARINQFNKSTYDIEIANAQQNVDSRTRRRQSETGYEMITPSTYDDSKALEEYYKKIVDIKKKAAEREYAIEQERLDKQLETDKKEEELRHKRLIDENGGEFISQLRAGLITQEEYDKLIEDENDAHYARMNAIDKQYASNLSAATEDNLEKVQKLYSDYYGNIINNIRKDKSNVDEIMSKQPATLKGGWGIVNIGQTSSNYEKALADYDKLRQEILKKQSELEQDLKNHNISAEDFAIRQDDLKKELKAIDDACTNVKERQNMLIGDFIQSIRMYVQAGLQGIQDVFSAVWDYQDYQFEKEQDELDKLNDELDKKLDEQEKIVEKHKSAIDEIEDELSTARGDRRQHLIDQLNAEMQAQRAAAAQEKKIQREKEAAEKKQEQLEKKRREEEYKRNVIQAFISWHMAIANGLATQPFLPVGIAMGALATALGAVQYALVKSQKPYKVGGQLEGGLVHGKRHNADGSGGVPVGNTGIFVEGQEYVIRRESTMPNLGLLEFINEKKRKINLNDIIDFYGGDVKKNIKNISPKRVFAEGGVIPTITNDIDINDRLITAMEAYAERPVVVSVVDINNRQDAVKNVQVLAGLTD